MQDPHHVGVNEHAPALRNRAASAPRRNSDRRSRALPTLKRVLTFLWAMMSILLIVAAVNMTLRGGAR